MKSLNTPKTNLRDRIFKLIFLAVFLLCLVIGVQLALRVRSRANPDPLTYIEHWTVVDAAGNRTEAGRTLDDERAFEEDFTIISQLPDEIGYDETGQDDIYMTALLHDIGIPDSIINKPGKLTPEEYAIIQKHPAMGAKILRNIKEKPELSEGSRLHHERYGGGGYPDGIRGEEIPERARLIAVADAYDAMTSYRSYRDPMAQEKVIGQITEGMGTQFDPRFAAIMLEMIAEDPEYRMCEAKTR